MRPLGELMEGLGVRAATGTSAWGSVGIAGVSEDSRRVGTGWLFVGRPGVRSDGAGYAGEAAARGAAAVLTRPGVPTVAGALHLVCEDPAAAGAVAVERWHGSPSRRLGVAAVTGTNGKTTVAWLVRELVRGGGWRCGLLGTVENDLGRGPQSATLTTPAAEELSASLAQMEAAGCASAAIEASSHALDQRRVDGLSLAVGVFTNLSGDHLDYHGTMEAYAAAKARLFGLLDAGAQAVVNADDPAGAQMVRGCRAPVLRCSLSGAPGAGAVGEVRGHGLGSWVRFVGPWGQIAGELGLVGRHNAMNALQAVATAHALGVAPAALEASLARLAPPPGRLEPVRPAGGGRSGPMVLVDYAHTDDALDKALKAVGERLESGRLWVVFGCGGDRDRGKRPRMGAVAGRLADEVVVTSDNPRSEDPERIIEEVLAGIGRGESVRAGNVRAEADRARAIGLAISLASEGDVVVIAGKGHEDYQILPDGAGGVVSRDFDDRAVAGEALRRRWASGEGA